MYDDLEGIDAALFNELQDAVNETVMRLIDARTETVPMRRTYAAIAGKALIMSGCQFIGSALKLSPDEGLAPGMALLAEFQRLARVKDAEQRSP